MEATLEHWDGSLWGLKQYLPLLDGDHLSHLAKRFSLAKGCEENIPGHCRWVLRQCLFAEGQTYFSAGGIFASRGAREGGSEDRMYAQLERTAQPDAKLVVAVEFPPPHLVYIDLTLTHKNPYL